MTIAFSTQWPKDMPEHMAGKPTGFLDKVFKWIMVGTPTQDHYEYWKQNHKREVFSSWKNLRGLKMKLHTIREDSNDRWKAGMDIHFVINNRTKNRYQFAPVVKCVSTQKIEVKWNEDPFPGTVRVFIDGEVQNIKRIESLAINDGFDSVEDFFSWFNKDFTGKIIHWTNLKY